MQSLYLWPDRPALSLFVLFVVTQLLFYAARVPMHRALRKLGSAVGGTMRMASRWMRSASDELRRRNREVLLEAARAEAEGKLEHELQRTAATFTAELKDYPALHRRLDECVKNVEADFKASAMVPTEAPGWPEAVRAVVNIPRAGDRTVQKVLDEIHRSAQTQEKKALQAYRDATAERHDILAKAAVHWKNIKLLLEQVGKAVTGTLEASARLDAHVERYEKIRRGEDSAERALAASALTLFILSAFVVAVAGFGGLVNFELIARPMSELVPGGGWVLGMPISKIAALVIVLMEVAAGIFIMESLGITRLFPRLAALPASRRRIIFLTALTGLAALACIEASLAILREQLLEADKALAMALSGVHVKGKDSVAAPLLSRIPVIGQAVLGFVLPWILAMIAVPLEMLVESGRHVVGRALVLVLRGLGVLLRLAGHAARALTAALSYAYDIYIIVPLQLERLVQHRGGHATDAYARVAGTLRNPAEPTAHFKAPR